MQTIMLHLRSIRGRITLIATALVAIILVVASVVLMRWVQADLLASAQSTLDEALEIQAEVLGVDAEMLVGADAEFFGPGYSRPRSKGTSFSSRCSTRTLVVPPSVRFTSTTFQSPGWR